MLQLNVYAQQRTFIKKSGEDGDSDSEDEFDAFENSLPFDSSLPHNYLKSQYELASKLAELLPNLAYDIFNDIVLRLDLVGASSHRQMLTFIIPWVQKMEFSEMEHEKLKKNLEVKQFLYTSDTGRIS